MSSDGLIERLELFGAGGTVTNPVALIRETVAELTQLRNDVEFYREWSNELAMNIPEEFDDDVAQEAIISKWAKFVAGELKRLHTWDGLISLLDEHWPADIFPTLPDSEDRDPGPRIVSLLRSIDQLKGAPAVFGLYETTNIGTSSSLRAVTFSKLTAEQWVAENDPRKTWETRSYQPLPVWTGRKEDDA